MKHLLKQELCRARGSGREKENRGPGADPPPGRVTISQAAFAATKEILD